MKKMSKKKTAAFISAAYAKVGHGRPVPIMSLGKIMRAGEAALETSIALDEAATLAAVLVALDAAISAVEVTS
jgi:hypothetical protein